MIGHLAVRELALEEFQLYWESYQRALQVEPLAFGDKFEDIATIDVSTALRYHADCVVIAAFDDDTVVGFVRLDLRTSIKLRHKCIFSTFFVFNTYRRRGVGSKLISEALAAARRREIEFVRLYVNTANESTIALYNRHGFETYAIERNAKKINGGYLDEAVMECDLRRNINVDLAVISELGEALET